MNKPIKERNCIGVIGLGYVGLPLAIGLSKKIEVRGFDINKDRVDDLSRNFDRGTQISKKEFLEAILFSAYSDPNKIKDCDTYMVTVPTPVDDSLNPDLSFLKEATNTVGKFLDKGNIVIFESTVYPGATEEFCIPILEEQSGLKCGEDFFVGYSPERVNPGDSNSTLQSVTKVVSATSLEVSKAISSIYEDHLGINTFIAKNIKTAEASKALENTQRDVNIALMNEISKYFKKLNLDTREVLAAAETKWNFTPYRPGLVGGHCIRVDPYYLIKSAEDNNISLDLVKKAREVNDGMANYVVNEIISQYSTKEIEVKHSNFLVLGLTYKENFPDVRSSLVFDIIKYLKKLDIRVRVFEPYLSEYDKNKIDLDFVDYLDDKNSFDGMLVAVAHKKFTLLSADKILKQLKKNKVIYDIKGILPSSLVDDIL